MMIFNPEADAERHQEILARVTQLIQDGGGEVANTAEWGRRKIAYPIAKQGDGLYVIVSCTTSPPVLEEISRVLAISKDIVLRALPIKVTPAEIEAVVKAGGIPQPVDERPEGESRPRGGRRGGGGGGGGRRGR
jgi:small subunit ribosomal protein S6